MKFSKRSIKKTLFVIVLIAGFSLTMNAQNVTVNATLGTSSASYSTLGSGFSAINSGTHKGVITISITGNTSESTSGAVLNASGSGSASYTSIRITPSGARTVTAAVTAGTALVAFNGADNVTIDGLNSGSNSLTFSNTTASATAGTSTIRFYGDATSNKITNCTILGSSTMSTTTNGGNIWFDGSAVSVGNDNDTISYCNIGPAGSNLPTKSIYSSGTTTSTAKYNSGILITGNNIYDYFNAAAQSDAIYISSGNSSWTISNNKFYQTATRTQTTGAIHSGINIASSVGNDNMLISGNTIGYASSSQTGTYTFAGVSSTSKFYPIYISSAPITGTACSIQGNTITAIAMSGAVSGQGYSEMPPFAGIYVSDDSALVDIGTVTGNIIGSRTASGAITFTSSSTSASDVYGIYFFPLSPVNISNNAVGGMTVSNSSTGAIGFYGIRALTWIYYVNTLKNDTVGYAAAPIRISASSSSASSRSIGIISEFGTAIIKNCVVSNITMDGANTSTGTSSAMIGICADRTSYYHSTQFNAYTDSALNVSYNTVHTLSNTSSGAVVVNGILVNADTSTNEIVSRNFIHSLSVANTSATINGFNILAGNATYKNNMVRLGLDGSGSSITTACKIYAINETGGPNNFYFNSIYIGGTGVGSTASATYAFYSTTTSVTRKIRNNIFQNSRSNTSTGGGKHYAVRVGGTGTNPSGLTINNNIYYISGTDGMLGYYNTSDISSLTSWKSTVGQDANSYVSDPAFKSPTNTSSLVDLHLQSLSNSLNPAERTGAAITEVTDDYDGQIRSTLSPTDIGADAGDFYSTVISYTNLSNATTTTNRTTTSFATITCNGVMLDSASSTTKPRMYYKKKSDANAFVGNTSSNNGWKNVSANGSSSPFNFTINYSIIYGGSVSLGDTIQYFVVAQDLASTPTVTCNPSTGFTGTSVSSITAAPTTPQYYTLVTPNVSVRTTRTTDTSWYSNLGNAFNAINAGTHTGSIIISIVANTSESTSGAVINASGSGSASYTAINITPSGARTVTAAVTAGNALVAFNGADNVTIDGLNSGSNSLTFSNTTASATAGTSTIRFYGDATSNKITNCTILGSATMSTSTSGGTIWFDGSAVTVGNDNDTISYCNIGPAGSNLPTKSIYAYGTTTSIDKYNSGILITYNNIYDYFNATAQSDAIYIGAGNSSWTISNNKFYQTATRTQTTGAMHTGINISSSYNDNISVTGNTIGYSSSSQTGTYTFAGLASSRFYPIIFSEASSSTASNIQGNTITAISVSGEISGTGTSNPFTAILVKSGLVNIGTTSGNTIGSKTSSGAITFTSSSTSTSEVYGIYFSPAVVSNINNNIVGGITASNSSTGAIIFHGMKAATLSTVINTFQNDTVGYSAAPISISASSSSSKAVGIYSQTGSSAITNCVVRNITMDGANTGTGLSSALIGFCIDGTSATSTAFNITTNTVNSLGNSASSAAVIVNGLVYNGPSSSSNIVSKNNVLTLSVSNTSATINGINIIAGNAIFHNNMIMLGTDGTGSNITTSCKINGIYTAGTGTAKYYYNSIYMKGTASSGSNSSYCYNRTSTEVSTLRNNLLYNERSGGSGAHAAIASANRTDFSSDYNLFVTTDTTKVGNYNGTNYNFYSWKQNTTGDASSWSALYSEVNSDSLFTNKSTGNLTIKIAQSQAWYVNGKGIAGTASGNINSGFGGQTRITTLGMGTDIGADEFTPTSVPPTATAIGNIANNATTRYIFAGREIASIKWKNASGTTTTFPSAISAYYYTGTNPPDPTNGGSNSSSKFTNCFWELRPTGGGHFLYDVTLNYDDALLGTLQYESDIKLGKKPTKTTTGDWKVNYGSTVNTTSNTVTFESLNGFSVYALSDYTSALPVTLSEFNAVADHDNALLTWKSTVEINSSHYNIMRSLNGIDFEKIGTESSMGNTSNTSNYSYIDENAAKLYSGKSVYYQLEMFDLDGSSKLSGIKTIFFKNNMNANSMTPYFSDENLNINFKLYDDSKFTISVIDMNGRLLFTNTGQYYKGTSNVTLNTNDIPTGIYLVRVESATETMVTKIYKK